MRKTLPLTGLRTEQAELSALVIPRGEIARYLGYRRIEPSEEIWDRIETCVERLVRQSTPRGAWQAFRLEMPEENHLHMAGLDIESRGLYRNCRGCIAIVMMAATIGPGCDFLIRRSEALSMTDAAIYQAAGAAAVEAWCDELNRRILAELWDTRGLRGHPRFSPGYGDLPLELQRDFFRILDLPRNCGLSLGETLLMSPGKSVTAFIGLEPVDAEELCAGAGEPAEDSAASGCDACGKGGDCAYHR